MESFSLLKYWRGGGGGATIAAAIRSSTAAPAVLTTVAGALIRPSSATTEDGSSDDDEGPFFDLEFATLPTDNPSITGSQVDMEEGEFNIELRSVGGGVDDGHRSEGFSPSDELFFKGKLLPSEPSSTAISASYPDNRSHISAVPLKSATKFRVFSLGLRKPKSAAEPIGASAAAAAAATASPKQPPPPPPQQHQQQSKFFVKFKGEEHPIVSLFTRDNSSRNSTNRASKRVAEDTATALAEAAEDAEEKRFAREVLHRYFNRIKPLYDRVSRKHGERTRLPEESEEETPAPVGSLPGNKTLPAGLRVVGKRLGKSWSTSAAVAAVPSPPPPPQRRDDTLLEQQDGIQSAIAHCKRSFTAPGNGSESPLVRSKSGPIRGNGD